MVEDEEGDEVFDDGEDGVGGGCVRSRNFRGGRGAIAAIWWSGATIARAPGAVARG